MGFYQFDENNRFIISDFQRQRPFSSTLPGIAGPMGIPLWVFYVNRGQGIASFGVENKDHPMMEFQPANKAYQSTPALGFRTLIKVSGQPAVYTPFAASPHNPAQQMTISFNELELCEDNPALGLRVEVRYFVLPEEPVAGLARQVKITNTSAEFKELELLDGLPVVIPYGVSNKDLKELHRTIEAWMEVYNLANQAPFFRLRSSPGDTDEVRPIRAGNFALAVAEQGGAARRLPCIVDPQIVFAQDTSLSIPENFEACPLAWLLERPQVTFGRTPCAFFASPAALAAGESLTVYSIYGNASRLELLGQLPAPAEMAAYFAEKRGRANRLVNELIAPIETHSGLPVFDAYCKQTFLDNALRGGWPVHLGSPARPVSYHIYSRKHGDLERDYNAFFMAAEFYSQGNGNYRDVNQNRRSEVWFDPRVEDSNIRSFISLIQPDGYNPLVVKGSRFLIPLEAQQALASLAQRPDELLPLLQKPFSPGGLLKRISDQPIALTVTPAEFLQRALEAAVQYFDADFGEGYWIDHWTYNLDLIENFLSIYPDRSAALLFGGEGLPYYDSPAFVQPRSQKHVLAGGQPRQYGALEEDEEKAAVLAARSEFPNQVRSAHGRGGIVRSSLYARLFSLALIKFASMDPFGMGVEMEAGKPAWCDALNGLPGLFGSSMSETYELARLLAFLRQRLPEASAPGLRLPVEAGELLQAVLGCLETYREAPAPQRDFDYWDAVSTAREAYREKVRFGFDGQTTAFTAAELGDALALLIEKVQAGIARAGKGGAVPPTYLIHDVTGYETLLAADGQPLTDSHQRPRIRVTGFQQRALPAFLEGPVRLMKILPDAAAARSLHLAVRASPLYDRALGMYVTNAPLEGQPMEIGRLRAFTPGWLENQSVFLHMEYKYLLALLRAGLYDEFFEDFRSALVAFQDPARYGRSPLENSSFIVSSAHPDGSLHGAGFVARLTGATAEFLSMWTLMMAGKEPFYLEGGELRLRLRPALPGWLFDQAGELSFTLLGGCQVTYHNPARRNTYADSAHIEQMRLYLDGETVTVSGNVIQQPYAAMLRQGQVRRIEAFISA